MRMRLKRRARRAVQPDDVRSENWTILCEGPSVLRAKPEDVLDGPVVAVNQAIRLHGTLCKVDVWCCEDGPRETPGFKPPRNVIAWSGSLKIWPWEKRYNIKCTGDEPPRLVGGKRNQNTIFRTIDRCVVRGAKHIRVIGADMNSPEQAERWKDERRLFAGLQAKCRNLGILLERYEC